ncbi:unnamed protein product [Allacma fusca]|uniref:Uncharacterized protein n=1 Tax=Allacma fusca TaxID=39272 RepID=A0A8J2J5D5_9HEXA|nr:unnamed protein product [Allacma fusca]
MSVLMELIYHDVYRKSGLQDTILSKRMEERQICCCGARTWTLVIGWLQIIGSVLGLLVMGFVSFLGMILYDLQHPITNLNAVLVAILIIAILSAAIALYILGIVMAIFLIRGCKDKNLRQINSWIIYAKITAVIYAGVLRSMKNKSVRKLSNIV